jgi:hypothetical protein
MPQHLHLQPSCPAHLASYSKEHSITYVEMVVALAGLLWISRQLHHPTNVTLFTDSSMVYHTLVKGTGTTLHSDSLLQNMYISWLINKVHSGHGLVVRWVPSADNLADPFSRGVLAP